MLVEKYLLSLGAPPQRVGFGQLVASIEYVIRHPDARYITKDVYPAVAMQCGTSVLCIDHNLRCIIEQIWRYGNQAMLSELFVPSSFSFRPSNKAFVYTLARHLSADQLAEDALHKGAG